MDHDAVLRKHMFDLPEDVIYLDGNSLGPLPRTAVARCTEVMRDQWGQGLIRAWNDHDWITLPRRVGDKIATLIGAAPDTVATGDTLSIKVYQALAAALQMRPDRHVILSDNGNFPTDLYMAKGLVELIGNGREVRAPAPEDVIAELSDDVAVVMLTQVDYRTGRLYDMEAVTKAVHASGAVMIWDLAHSAGALPIDLAASQCEFAVGCTYKYLNGGPGSPAFIYVRPDLIARAQPALCGWMGHAAPFAMETEYRPAPSIERMRVGTPPILQLSVLDAALDIWESVDMHALRAASIALSDQFIAEIEAEGLPLELASPRDGNGRGSQVSFRFEHGYAAIQALIDRGVIGDFRAPDIMRFGFTPLYIDAADVSKAVGTISAVMKEELWRNARYQTKSKVT